MRAAQVYIGKPKDYELLTAIIAVRELQSKGYHVVLYTDTKTLEYFKLFDFHKIYNEINTNLLSKNYNINKNIFWAYGKILAYQNEPIGTLFIDFDLILWEELPNNNVDLIACSTDFYNYETKPESRNLKSVNKLGYNASLLVFKNKELKDKYTSEAIKYMQNFTPIDDENGSKYMCFVEQNWLKTVFKNVYLVLPNQTKAVTHLWGYKTILNTNVDIRKAFIEKCKRRIENDYLVNKILKNEIL